MGMMPLSRTARSIPIARRVNRFSYAIRNIVAEAQAVEAAGTSVRYLNIGDPASFGFQPPLHMQRQVGISPVFVIIALLIGGSLLGVIGAILAVPTAAILQVLLEETLSEPAE